MNCNWFPNGGQWVYQQPLQYQGQIAPTSVQATSPPQQQQQQQQQPQVPIGQPAATTGTATTTAWNQQHSCPVPWNMVPQPQQQQFGQYGQQFGPMAYVPWAMVPMFMPPQVQQQQQQQPTVPLQPPPQQQSFPPLPSAWQPHPQAAAQQAAPPPPPQTVATMTAITTSIEGSVSSAVRLPHQTTTTTTSQRATSSTDAITVGEPREGKSKKDAKKVVGPAEATAARGSRSSRRIGGKRRRQSDDEGEMGIWKQPRGGPMVDCPYCGVRYGLFGGGLSKHLSRGKCNWKTKKKQEGESQSATSSSSASSASAANEKDLPVAESSTQDEDLEEQQQQQQQQLQIDKVVSIGDWNKPWVSEEWEIDDDDD